VGHDRLLSYVKPGVFIYLDARDTSLTPCIARDGVWESHISRFISRTLSRGGTFLDIGANVGYHALIAAKRVGPTGLVVAFEPQAALCDLLERSVCANLFQDRLRLERVAIGAQQGIASLGKFFGFTGSATFLPNHDVVEHEEVPMVPLPVALSALSAQLGRPIVPDLIKIDVEGLEFELWDGMKEWSRSLNHLTVVLEFSPACYRGMGRDPHELLQQFRDFGFTMSRFRQGFVVKVSKDDCFQMGASNEQVDLILRK
jgi:FkbM family methyltransferase